MLQAPSGARLWPRNGHEASTVPEVAPSPPVSVVAVSAVFLQQGRGAASGRISAAPRPGGGVNRSGDRPGAAPRPPRSQDNRRWLPAAGWRGAGALGGHQRARTHILLSSELPALSLPGCCLLEKTLRSWCMVVHAPGPEPCVHARSRPLLRPPGAAGAPGAAARSPAAAGAAQLLARPPHASPGWAGDSLLRRDAVKSRSVSAALTRGDGAPIWPGGPRLSPSAAARPAPAWCTSAT